MNGKVWLVGAGPGDPGLLTLKGARLVERCDVLVYDYLAAAPIVDLAPPSCERVYVGKRARMQTMPQAEISALLVRYARDGKRVVRLKGGDVFVFGRGGEEAQALHEAGIPFEIVPGISSVFAAPAYAGIPVTHREHNTTLTISSGHEDPQREHSRLDYAQLAKPNATTIFVMAMGQLAPIVERLRAHGLPDELPVAIVQEGTRPRQRTLVATVGTIVAEATRAKLSAPAIVIVGNVVREREALRWFDCGPLFGKRVLITRPAVRADAFAQQLWEIGAEPIHAATIAYDVPDDPAPAAAALAALRAFAWVVFTSRAGVEAAFDGLAARGADARTFGDARVAAIGPATAAALLERGLRADFVPSAFVNEAVAAGLLDRTRAGERILLFRAQVARNGLPAALRDAGRLVEDVAAYRTRLVDDPQLRAKTERADVVTFTSSSTVEGLLRNVPDAADLLATKLVAAIGPITAQTARSAGIRVDVVPTDATVEGLVAALASGVAP